MMRLSEIKNNLTYLWKLGILMAPSSANQPSFLSLYVWTLPPMRPLASIIVTYKSREKRLCISNRQTENTGIELKVYIIFVIIKIYITFKLEVILQHKCFWKKWKHLVLQRNHVHCKKNSASPATYEILTSSALCELGNARPRDWNHHC